MKMKTEKATLIIAFQEWISFIRQLERCEDRVWNLNIAEGKWSIREIIAHIALWDEYFWDNGLSKVASGLPLTIKHLDFDEFNITAKNYGLNTTIAILAKQSINNRERIINLIQSLSDQQYEAEYKNAEGQPFTIAQYMKDFISHDRHHIEQMNDFLESANEEDMAKLNLKIEELSLNAWPALQTVVMGGWLLRFADGYTKRSNCVVPLYRNDGNVNEQIRYCEQLFAQQQLNTVFKITSFAKQEQLDQTLDKLGYLIVDPVFVKTIQLTNVKAPSEAISYRIEEQINEAWLNEYTGMSTLSDRNKEIAVKLLSCMPLRKCFLTLYENNTPVACGIGIIEQGYIGLYDIVTDSNYRNRGIGEQLILRLLQWGKQNGAEHSYLMVVQDNKPANRLYDKIGYTEQYQYWYRVQVGKDQ